MKKFESPSLTMHNVTIVTRLRSPIISTKKSQRKNSKEKPTSKSSNKSSYTKTNSIIKSKYPRNNDSKSQNKQILKSKDPTKHGLNENIFYTMFTSQVPCNLMLVSSKPIEGSTINQAFQTQNDLYDFGKNFLKESALFEFDKIYNETNSIDMIYKELIKDNISNLFQKKNSCVILYGPIDGGKSFLLRGGSTPTGGDSGLLSRGIRDIFRLISLYNQANNNSSSFHAKITSYQIYLDNIHDLLSKDSYMITIEKYLDNNYVNTNLIGLNEKEIKNMAEYESCMREAVHNRATLSQKLKINDINRKSYFIISLRLEKKIYSKDGVLLIDDNFKNFSRIDFVELASSNFGITEQFSENDSSPKAMLYRNTENVFNSLCENIVCSCNGTTSSSDSALTLALKNSINIDSNIVFINCVIPWESPPNYSYKAVKFTNWLRNMVLDQNKNLENIEQNVNEMNNNNNSIVKNEIVNNSNSYERLPSVQRNNAYENNFKQQKRNLNIINIEKNNNTNTNKYNTNTYQNKIDKNNGIYNNIIKSDYEEQPGNLTMLNNHPELINLSSNTTASDIYKNPRYINENNKTNISANLPNSEKINTNINKLEKRNNNKNNHALYINDNSEMEIKSIRDKIRKKYKSPSRDNSNIQSYSQNIISQNIEQNEIKPYEHVPSYNVRNEKQRIKLNNMAFTNTNQISNNNIDYNINNSNNEFDVSKIINPQELKIKELENKVKLLEEKSFENTQKLEEIRTNKETISYNNNNINNNLNSTLNNTNNNMNYANNNATISYLPDAEVEKIKQEHAILKSDNIIFREDINRLTDINHHLENELIEQRNRNIELANENEQLTQEKNKIEKELKTALETIDKIKLKETSLEQFYNERLMLQNRMKENEDQLRKTVEEKSKYEIDYKVLQAKYAELNTRYDKINEEYSLNKKKHDEELIKIEEKVDIMTKEIEKLQGENNILRQDSDKKNLEVNNISMMRDNYKDKFEEEKRRNEVLCEKIKEIENEFKILQNDKNDEMMIRYRMEENKKIKYENKNKIISELQDKIKNYRNQRMMMKKNQEDEY